MKMLLKPVVPLGLALLLGVAGCRPSGKKETAKPSKDQPIPVEVAEITRGRIETVFKTVASLEAEEEVKVFARTSNRVMELLVEEGDAVEKGDVLLKLDDDIQKTQFGKAEVKLAKAREEFGRQQALFEQKLVSEQTFKDAQFELRQLELALEDARRDLEYTTVRAPISGTVSRRLVKTGDLVNLNQHLFDLVNFDSVVARIYVPESNLGDLKVKLPARVISTAYRNQVFAGYVKRIAPVVDSKTGTVKVTIGLEEIGPLRPGMYVEVALVTADRQDAILISKRALQYDGDQIYVFRLLPDRKVERVLVEVGLRDSMNVAPVSGFQEGDQIVVAGQTGLKNGAKVRLPGDPEPDEKKSEVAKKAD